MTKFYFIFSKVIKFNKWRLKKNASVECMENSKKSFLLFKEGKNLHIPQNAKIYKYSRI